MSQFERVLVNIREKCHLDSPSVDAEEWSTFQNSLRIIQTCGICLIVDTVCTLSVDPCGLRDVTAGLLCKVTNHGFI